MPGLKRSVQWGGRLLVGVCFLWLSYLAFDFSYILIELKELFSNFWVIGAMTAAYLSAFLIRAKAWQLYVDKSQPLKQFVDGLLYSLFINHLLPVKAGDVVRAGYLVNSTRISWKSAIESVVVMRSLDLMILGSISLGGVLYLGLSISYLFLILLVLAGSLVMVLIFFKENWRTVIISQIKRVGSILFSGQGVLLFFLIAVSWGLEAIIVFAVATQFSSALGFLQSLWVNSFTIAGQVFHFSPGGIGTYESFMSFALRASEVPIKNAYTIAILTHGFKFIFSFAVGLYLILSVPISLKTIKGWLKRKED
ncbi:lysylphosphatidylglycerol synthase transmembrane domain-containing protein [Halobacillus litoralis]|uniref:lysylphosphatidylglycerol synthase transmembrane domain-containing protein n=1 Tax=Halobacillus litoralis TaxID=45668 RepID=UPI001CFD2F38|nr:lysylphosphatidylglycerol synthase transmembrane domain-containing protein [Halobacillus litoralis]